MLLTVLFSLGCTPDDDVVCDTSLVNLDEIASIDLLLNSSILYADGKAEVELRPQLTTNDGYIVPDYRLKEEWFEYTSNRPNVVLSRRFSTKSNIGSTFKVQVRLKGRDVVSNEIVFQVLPAPQKFDQVVFPIVFHIIQNSKDIVSFGGPFSAGRIHQELERINRTFSGLLSATPNGSDSYISFRMAEYDPYGKRMAEPGINRLVVNNITTEHPTSQAAFEDLIKEHSLLWPADKYLNIWLIGDRGVMDARNSGHWLGYGTTPKYYAPGYDAVTQPKGLILNTNPPAEPLANDIGIRYRLWDLNENDRVYGAYFYDPSPIGGGTILSNTNDLVCYFGRYFGLLDCYAPEMQSPEAIRNFDDYCTDTHKYGAVSSMYKGNVTLYKSWPVSPLTEPEGARLFWMSENIMEDQTGLHRSISADQVKRIRWVINNCEFRQAWKSDAAFTGK